MVPVPAGLFFFFFFFFFLFLFLVEKVQNDISSSPSDQPPDLKSQPATGEPHPSEARLLKYVLRILGSRLSASVVDDPQHAADGIKKRLATRGRIDDALRLSSLSTALIGQNVIRAKWAILHVLSTVARESPSGGASGDGGGAAGGGNQAGLGET